MTDKADAFLEKLVALGGELVDAAKPLAKVATEATFAAVQIKGIAAAVEIGVSAAAAFAGVRFAMYLKRRGTEYYEQRKGYSDDRHMAWHISAMTAGFVSAILALNAIFTACSSATWMALFRPDAYLAAKALGL